MRHERQVELLQRVADAGPHLAGLHGPASRVIEASTYTDPERLRREVEVLFRDGPTLFALSDELPDPGSYLASTVGGVPIAVVRQPDGALRALVNICRHRGAPLVPTVSQGDGVRSFTCPYHGWVYGSDGALLGRPHTAGAFDDVTLACDLGQVAVAERHGLVFVRAGGREPIDVDEVLGGAEDDLGSFGLGGYTHVESRTSTWRMNWKLVLDTFTESYHIRVLHKGSIAPLFDSDGVIFEAFGRNCVSIGLRRDVRDELRKPVDEWSLLPYGTIQYFVVPNALVVHQLDHVEVWRVEPIDVRTTRVTTSIHAPAPPHTDKAQRYWTKNLDLLLQVTGTEDFPLMESIQANLDAGAATHLVHGRNEAALVHLHRVVDEALAGA